MEGLLHGHHHGWLHEAQHVLTHGLMITGFVAVMMLVVEYVNVLSRGVWIRALGSGRWRQYLLAALLGAVPGCLGAFVVISLFIHRRLTMGAVVTAMIATVGDETFVLLAMVPGTAAWMIPALALLGIPAGFITDLLRGDARANGAGCELELHEEHAPRACFAYGGILAQWRPPSPRRAVLAAVLALFALASGLGWIGGCGFDWMRITLMVAALVGLSIAATVSDHFLDEHLWNHVVRRHVPRIFLWTMGALVVIHALDHFVDLEAVIGHNLWLVLLIAVAVGFVPESGPHLVFITLFAAGKLPLSILLASSIVQDGHGMLPLLAHSRRDFLTIKVINAALGLLVGALMLAAGL